MVRAPGSPVSNASAFDADRLRSELADPTALRGIVQDTLSELPGHVYHLRVAHDDGRLESLATHARRLAQLFAGLLAFPASEAALRLRYAAEVASPETGSALSRLEQEMEILARALAAEFDILY